jgi:hypothetical protein
LVFEVVAGTEGLADQPGGEQGVDPVVRVGEPGYRVVKVRRCVLSALAEPFRSHCGVSGCQAADQFGERGRLGQVRVADLLR